MSLLQWGDFTLHSGAKSWWRIDCDAFTDSEIHLLAKMISEKIGYFNVVICPKSHPGSAATKLRDAVRQYANPRMNYEKPVLLIVDDVVTTGSSMNELYVAQNSHYHEIYGAVIFARGECPDWVESIFRMN